MSLLKMKVHLSRFHEVFIMLLMSALLDSGQRVSLELTRVCDEQPVSYALRNAEAAFQKREEERAERDHETKKLPLPAVAEEENESSSFKKSVKIKKSGPSEGSDEDKDKDAKEIKRTKSPHRDDSEEEREKKEKEVRSKTKSPRRDGSDDEKEKKDKEHDKIHLNRAQILRNDGGMKKSSSRREVRYAVLSLCSDDFVPLPPSSTLLYFFLCVTFCI